MRDHYDDPESFDASCIELEMWCYENGNPELAEYAMAHRCPETSFVPM